MKHASASRLELRILFSHKEIVLSVADDGVGLEKATTETHPDHGFGIRGMQERATRIGGVLQIEKVVPRGTRVVVTIPISSS
jgi:signal transduction histidine kinase